jgi:hypothetical protein
LAFLPVGAVLAFHRHQRQGLALALAGSARISEADKSLTWIFY